MIRYLVVNEYNIPMIVFDRLSHAVHYISHYPDHFKIIVCC